MVVALVVGVVVVILCVLASVRVTSNETGIRRREKISESKQKAATTSNDNYIKVF